MRMSSTKSINLHKYMAEKPKLTFRERILVKLIQETSPRAKTQAKYTVISQVTFVRIQKIREMIVDLIPK